LLVYYAKYCFSCAEEAATILQTHDYPLPLINLITIAK